MVLFPNFFHSLKSFLPIINTRFWQIVIKTLMKFPSVNNGVFWRNQSSGFYNKTPLSFESQLWLTFSVFANGSQLFHTYFRPHKPLITKITVTIKYNGRAGFCVQPNWPFSCPNIMCFAGNMKRDLSPPPPKKKLLCAFYFAE